MKKLFLSLFWFSFFFLCSVCTAEAFVSFENLKYYDIRLISNERGISTFSGTNNGLRLKVIAEDNHILKIVLMFDFENSGAKLSAHALEIAKIISELKVGKTTPLTETQDMLYKKLDAMKRKQDTDIFTLNGLRFECLSSNGMMNIRITE